MSATAINTLRRVVLLFNAGSEEFAARFDVEQLVQLHAMCLASAWDFHPENWTDRQVLEALLGVVPQWDEDERAVYVDRPAAERNAALEERIAHLHAEAMFRRFAHHDQLDPWRIAELTLSRFRQLKGGAACSSH